VDGRLAEAILGHPTLYNRGWEELNALWSGRRDEVVWDYCEAQVGLARALEWDYLRVPAVFPRGDYRPPRMTGRTSWIDEGGLEMHLNPDYGSIILPLRYPEMSVEDLLEPEEPVTIDTSQLEAVRHVVGELGATHFVVGRLPVDGTFPWEHTVGMDLRLLKLRYGDKLCFFGGVDCDTLIAADAEGVRQEVRYALRNAAPGGDLVVTSSNVLQPGMKLENYLAMRDELRKHGAYPICLP